MCRNPYDEAWNYRWNHKFWNYQNIFSLQTLKLINYTQPARDVPGMSPKGRNVRDLHGTFRGLLRNQQKNWWFDKKRCFLDAIVFVLHNFTVFYWKNKYAKVVNGDVHGTPTGPSCGTSRGPNDGTFWGRPRDVGHICFQNSTQNHIKLTSTGYSRLYSELW